MAPSRSRAGAALLVPRDLSVGSACNDLLALRRRAHHELLKDITMDQPATGAELETERHRAHLARLTALGVHCQLHRGARSYRFDRHQRVRAHRVRVALGLPRLRRASPRPGRARSARPRTRRIRGTRSRGGVDPPPDPDLDEGRPEEAGRPGTQPKSPGEYKGSADLLPTARSTRFRARKAMSEKPYSLAVPPQLAPVGVGGR